MVFEKYSCHCETSAHTGRGNPPVSVERFRKLPKSWDSSRFSVVIVTCFLSTGGLPHHLSALVRNDRKFGVSASNANLSPHRTVLKKTSPEAGRPPGEWGDSVRRSGGRRRRCRHYRLWPPAGRCSHGTHGQPLSAPVSRSISTGREYPWR